MLAARKRGVRFGQFGGSHGGDDDGVVVSAAVALGFLFVGDDGSGGGLGDWLGERSGLGGRGEKRVRIGSMGLRLGDRRGARGRSWFYGSSRGRRGNDRFSDRRSWFGSGRFNGGTGWGGGWLGLHPGDGSGRRFGRRW